MTFKTVAFTIYVLRRYGEYLWRGRRWRPTDDFAVRFLYPHSAEHCAASLHLSDIEIVESDIHEELSMATTLRSGLPLLSRVENALARRHYRGNEGNFSIYGRVAKMTVVVFRDGILAADSRFTIETDAGGARMGRCEKLYRKIVGTGRKRHEVIMGCAGDASPSLIFVDWYGSDKPPPQVLADMQADFSILLYSKHGLFEYDAYCRAERVLEKFWAIGSGAKAALGAMHMGASARQACAIACKIDPYSGVPISTLQLEPIPAKRKRASP